MNRAKNVTAMPSKGSAGSVAIVLNTAPVKMDSMNAPASFGEMSKSLGIVAFMASTVQKQDANVSGKPLR